MDVLEVIRKRRSVRQYLDKPIDEPIKNALDEYAKELSSCSGLNLKIVYDEDKAFKSVLAKYGKFENVKNYIAIFGVEDMSETAGYYGEKLVLKAQELGLNTCWVALTFSKNKVKKLGKGEKLYLVISLGYGKTQGVNRKSKSVKDVVEVEGETPEKFYDGVEACLLAPTAINQQKFKIICKDKNVSIVKNGVGFYTQVDLGIIKCHFELVTGIKVFDK